MHLILENGEDAVLPGQGKVGRPAATDEQAEKEIDEAVLAGNLNSNSLKFDDDFHHGVLLAALRGTQERRGQAPVAGLPDQKTIDAILDRAEVRVVKGRVITMARWLALQDPRAPICSTIANELYVMNKLPNLVLNFDDTTYVVSSDGKCRILLSSNAPPELDTRFLSNSELPMGVKVRVTIAANGYASPPVFVIANDNVPVGTIIAVKVKGLSHSTDPTAEGTLIFASTRGGNVEMNKYYYEKLLCPEIVKIRAGCTFPEGATDFDKSATVCLDGEDSQVKALLLPLVRALLKETNVDALKSNASLSLAEQALDAGDMFRGGKLKMSTLTSEQAFDASLSLSIAAALNHPSLAVLKLPAGKITKIVDALLKVTNVLKRVTTYDAIIDSFKKVGQAGTKDTWVTLNRPRAFGLTSKGQTTSLYKFSALEWRHIQLHWDEMKESFRSNGRLSDEVMDTLGMPRFEGKPGNHEDKALSHQRTTLLTDEETIARYDEYHLAKQQAAAAAVAKKTADDARKGDKEVGAPILEECRVRLQGAVEVKIIIDKWVDEIKVMMEEVKGSVQQEIVGALQEFKQYDKKAKEDKEEGRKLLAEMRGVKARAEEFFKVPNLSELKVKHSLLHLWLGWCVFLSCALA